MSLENVYLACVMLQLMNNMHFYFKKNYDNKWAVLGELIMVLIRPCHMRGIHSHPNLEWVSYLIRRVQLTDAISNEDINIYMLYTGFSPGEEKGRLQSEKYIIYIYMYIYIYSVFLPCILVIVHIDDILICNVRW